MKKLISLLLSLAMLFSLAACTTGPAATTAPEDPGKALYAQASDALDQRSDVSLELIITTLTNIDGDEYSSKSTQTLTYAGKGTENAVISADESIEFSVHSPEYEKEKEDVEPLSYQEIWNSGTVYVLTEDNYRYRSEMDAEAAGKRFMPVVLLDETLYGTITSTQAETGTTVTFADPTAAESWALPEGGKLVEASGTAFVTAEGNLTEMNYKVTYAYGPTEVTLTVDGKVLEEAKTVSAPENAAEYVTISYIDALRLNLYAVSNLLQTDTLTLQQSQSLTSQAAGVVKNQSVKADMHGRVEETIAKFETDVYLMDYSTGKSEELKQEEKYQDGKLTTVTNGGLPSTNSISYEIIRTYAAGLLLECMMDMDYWEDATATDLGSVLLLEYKLNENFGNTMQNSICTTLWNDPSFLLNLSSDYKNADCTGYLSIDKYTGLPVASGYYYKGVHTIEKKDYELTMQVDQSIESPSKGAYQEITDKLPPEEAPETKPSPLFYKVTGKDGQQMWLLGTIHIGDERTAYLPQEIRKAFEASDALALECNTEAFDEQVEKDDKLAAQVSALYFSADGKEIVKGALESEDYTRALQLLKAVGGNNMNMPYAKPYVWSNAIEMFYLRQAYQLHGDQGIEERLMDWAEELDVEILEIESNMAQLKMLTGFSTDLQMLMLEEMLQCDAAEYQADTLNLFELWCAGDEEALRTEIASEWDEEGLTEEEKTKYKPLYEEYDKAMNVDRNKGMLDAAVKYLESGKVVFYAVGLAHLLDSTNGLVDTLQDAGYTVERVTFAN